MKKSLFITCLCLFASVCLNAQTNTFPTSGNVGIGTSLPNMPLTIVGASSTEYEGTDNSIGGGHHLELIGTSTDKALLKGPTITFRSPANTNGSSSWATVRLMGAPASTSTSNAIGAFHIQVRDQYNPGVGGTWNWRTGLSVINNGNVGIGTTNPSAKLHVQSGNTGFSWSPIVGTTAIYENNISNRSFVTIIGKSNGQSELWFGDQESQNSGRLRYDHSSETLSLWNGGGEKLTVNLSGNIGIGTTTPDAKLTVKGNIHAQEVKVDLLGAVAPDYVFYKDYDLKSLKAVEDYIINNGHLPNIPSAKDMETEGIMLKEMNLKLLEKIEELTLYAIQQEKETIAVKEQLQNQEIINKDLQEKFQSQETRLQNLETLLNSKK